MSDKRKLHDQIHSLEGEVKYLKGQIAYLVDDWKKWQEGSQRQAEKEVKASGSVKEPYYDGWQVMTSQFDTLTQRFDTFNGWMDEQKALMKNSVIPCMKSFERNVQSLSLTT